MDYPQMTSLLGVIFIFAVGYGLSRSRSKINWRTVGGAFAIQALIGGFVLYTSFGAAVLNNITSFVQTIIDFSKEGTGFLFGPLSDLGREPNIGFIFAFQVLPIIIFFSSLIAVLPLKNNECRD
jgi:CNT family concentrative nucleoside transporter